VIVTRPSLILFDDQANIVRIYLLSGLFGLLGILGGDMTSVLHKTRVIEELERLEGLLDSVALEILDALSSLSNINKLRDRLNTLYRVLAQHWQKYCCHPLVIRLLLARFDSQSGSADEALFEMLVSHDSGAHHEWLEFQVGVGGPTRHVSISDPSRESHPGEGDEVGDFCKFVKSGPKLHGRRTHLRIVDDYLLRGTPTKPNSRNNESISLSEILRHRDDLHGRDRSILNIVLVQAFLQLFGSPWLQEGWDKNHIYFSRTEDGALDLTRPYLSTRLATKQYEERREILPYRSILDLGILLLEVELWLPFEPPGPLDSPEKANSDGYLAAGLSRIIGRRRDRSDHFLRGARACLEVQTSAHKVYLDQRQLLQEVYLRVLEPLRHDFRQHYNALPGDLRMSM